MTPTIVYSMSSHSIIWHNFLLYTTQYSYVIFLKTIFKMVALKCGVFTHYMEIKNYLNESKQCLQIGDIHKNDLRLILRKLQE